MMGSENKHIILLIILAGCVMLWQSCSKDNFSKCLKGRGSTTDDTRGLYPFGSISVYDNISLKIFQGEWYSVKVITGENIIPAITTRIENNTLFLRNESVCPMFTDPWNCVKVELTLPDFDTLFISTAGDVEISQAFKTGSAWVRLEECSGDINLTFDVFRLYVHYQSGTSNVWINGDGHDGIFFTAAYGVLDTRGFQPKHAIINNSSTNNCYVTSGTLTLDANITNMGDIYYRRDPRYLIENIEGPGRLIRLD